MSTLEVACGRCDKRFRVRAEFAGKSTRCPGCSAPITISGSKAPAPRADRPEPPRPRSRPRDDDEDRPRPAGDWTAVATALGREQVAVLAALTSILGSYLVFCLANLTRHAVGDLEGLAIAAMVLLLIGPVLVATIFGVTARVAAAGAPADARARGSAAASLVCAFAALASLLLLGLTSLMGMNRYYGPGLPAVVSVGGVVVSALGAVGTFLGFVAQVGIAARSAEIGRAIGRTAVAAGACVGVLIALTFLVTLAMEATGTVHSSRGEEPFAMILTGVLIPVGLATMLVMYHRLLGAARQAVRGEPAGRYDD